MSESCMYKMEYKEHSLPELTMNISTYPSSISDEILEDDSSQHSDIFGVVFISDLLCE